MTSHRRLLPASLKMAALLSSVLLEVAAVLAASVLAAAQACPSLFESDAVAYRCPMAG